VRDALVRPPHDIGATAETLGTIRGSANPAASLCRLLEHTHDMKRNSARVVTSMVERSRDIASGAAGPEDEKKRSPA